MTETIITIKLVHSKPLPAETTDVVSQRVYGWLFNKGVPVEVTAGIVQMPKLPGREDK